MDQPDTEKYISAEEACELLETDEWELDQLIHRGQLHAFRIAGDLIRFRKDQVSEIKAKWRIHRELFPAKGRRAPHRLESDSTGPLDRLADFFRFNDFYIVSALVTAALIVLIVSSR